MSLINFIQKIQKKPHHVRIKLLWASVSVCMLFIISIWVVSLKHSLLIEEEDKNSNIIKDEAVSLKKAFEANIGSFFENKNKEMENNLEEIDFETDNQNEVIENGNPEQTKPSRLPL